MDKNYQKTDNKEEEKNQKGNKTKKIEEKRHKTNKNIRTKGKLIRYDPNQIILK